MCGGKYHQWKKPRQLTRIFGETLIERTTRLLKMCGVSGHDIWVSTSNAEMVRSILQEVPHTHIVVHNNPFEVISPSIITGYWCDCFYPMTEPCTYIMGDVVFSEKAIETIVKTETTDIEFFASAPPFTKQYSKEWAEPFAFKVFDQEHLKSAQLKTKQLWDEHKFNRHPIAWEFWQVVKDTPLNQIDYTNYTVINDYTCDIDKPEDIKYFEGVM
jgi:hypothetical protein